MEKKQINILLVGTRTETIKQSIQIENCSIFTKRPFAGGIKLIKKISPDVVVLKIKSAERKTLIMIDTLLKINPELIIIIVPEIYKIEKYLKFISAGAEDCVYLKDIHTLNQKILFALSRRQNTIHVMCKNSHDKYNLINNNIKDVIWIMNPDLKFIYLSPSVKNLRGFTAEEMMHQKFEELFIPESLKSVKKVINDFFNNLNKGIISKESFKFEVEQPHKNGTTVPVEVIVTPVFNENNNFKYFLGVARDISERKLKEAEIIRAKEDFKLLIENQNDLIVKLDPEFNITFASPQYCKAFNINEEEILGKQYTPLIHPDDLDSAIKSMGNLLKPPYKIIHTERMLTPEGWVWFQWSDKAIVDKKGIIKEIISVGRNIHHQKLSDDKVKQSERKFSNLIQNLPGMVYSCQNIQDWTMEIVSNGCLDLTGYTPDELQKDTVVSYNDIIHPDDRSYVWNAVQESLKNHQHFELKYRIITKQGKEKWVWERGSFAYRTEDKKDILEGFIFDITDKVKAEKALIESEKQFRFLSENADDLIYIYEFVPEPRFKYVSPSATKITGYTPEEHYADPQLGFKLIHPDDVHILQDASNGLYNSQPIVLRWKKKDGTIIWTEQRNVSLYDENGNLIALQGIARDITERKLAEEKIRESEEKYRLIFSTVNDALILMDLRGNIIDCNKKTAEFYGGDINEMIGTQFIQLGIIPQEISNEITKKFKKALLLKEMKFEFS
ncbi:PAS domain S-box protein, partial [Bacteroidetes/Chlorobi group bacterium ChocPot_Mid]